MYTPLSPALPVTLLNLLLLSLINLTNAISDRSICVRQNAPLLAEAAACGNRISLQSCLLDAPNFVTLDDLQRCFIDANCAIAEATSEAIMILGNCDGSNSAPELRRRGPEALPAETSTPQINNKSPESTSPATATSTGLTMPSECSTARMISTTVCPVTSLGKDNFSNLPCTSTILATIECAATNICFDDGSCTPRDSPISASGIVVAIIFALAVTAVVAVLLFFYAKERKARRIAREEAEKTKRESEQKAAEESQKKLAKILVERDRARRQKMEARDWAHRRAMEGCREENPFEDGASSIGSVRRLSFER
ncbi:hypothetical protein F5Y10DRAFT_131215 [Nemania abortiva]|nr:hypothetical protein F5Y10DRAFT_131215 [Nemania abortiva]